MTGALAHADHRESAAGAPALNGAVVLTWRFRRRPEEPEGTLRVRLDIVSGRARAARWEARVGAGAIGLPNGLCAAPAASIDASLGLLHLDGAPDLTATIDLRTGGPLYARTALLGAIGAGPGSHELIDEPALTEE